MKKKNLIILLLIPFLIALLGIATINTTFHFIDNDIVRIDWDYNDFEAFEVRESMYLLKADGISEKNYPAGPGNNLIWSVKNKDENDDNIYARIVKKNNNFYLEALLPGEVIVTCSNEKGNIFKYMNVVIYEGGYILINPKISGSQNNIDEKNIYYGQYDLTNGVKTNAVFEFVVTSNRDSILDSLIVKEQSEYLDVDIKNRKVTIKAGAEGLQSFTIGCESNDTAKPVTYTLNIVKDGVNVYTYEDLLNCTNRSTNGEIVVLRKSFEKYEDYIQLKNNKNNVEHFGTYNSNNQSFNFENEVYTFETTFCSDYIDKWNEHVKGTNLKSISKRIVTGLHIQKDFYGNGYQINMHDLTFPTDTHQTTTVDPNGNYVVIPYPADKDLFKGPRPFYTLGDHSNTPLIEALGQDNIGMYIDGDNITINDVDVRNCDFGNILRNLQFTGTVMETNGNNITVKNSRLSNGKHVLRSYSSMNMKLINCMLKNAMNFLLSVGTNEYIKVDSDLEKEFVYIDDTIITSKIGEYLLSKATGDDVLNIFLAGTVDGENFITVDKTIMRKAILSIQNALNDELLIDKNYKGSIDVIDTLFDTSGISSISIDSMFNGPFLYSGVPSIVSQLLNILVDYIPSGIGGMSYPVKVKISGKTKFYDYKQPDEMDISGLINENITQFVKEAEGIFGTQYDGVIDINTIFPIKTYLMEKTPKYLNDGKTYINVPVAFYGGGLNLSTVEIDTLDMKKNLSNKITIDLLDRYLNLQSTTQAGMIKNVLLKCVTIVTGYEPFEFICMDSSGYLYGEHASVNQLRENVKGE